MDSNKLIETVKEFTPPAGFDMYAHELDAIWNAANNEPFYCTVYAFRYGFLKGQRAERARVKKKGMKQYGKETG